MRTDVRTNGQTRLLRSQRPVGRETNNKIQLKKSEFNKNMPTKYIKISNNFKLNYTNHILTKQAVMRGPTRVQRKESEKHPFRRTPKKPQKTPKNGQNHF